MGVADVGVPTATTSTLRLSAARDGYVEGSGPDDTGAIVDNANKSFAAEPVMLVKHRPDQPLVWRLAFVSFDIPAEAASSSVDRATLTVTGQMNDPMAASRLIVSSVPSPTWTEPTLTWSAEPAVGNPLGTLVVTGKPQALSLDVTSYARAAVEAGAKRIDFAIAQDPDVAYLTSARAELASREAGAAGPTLTIVARVARVARR
jgi:hypothetical protein